MFEMKLRVAGFEKESIVDGPGIRYVLFLQGCVHNCPGCHNPQTHPLDGGSEINVIEIVADIHKQRRVDGVTFSGGDPFLQAKPLLELAKILKKDAIHLMVYSGFTYEQLLEQGKKNAAITELLNLADILVDGPFILEKKDLALAFRGSSNQRLIDLAETRKQGRVAIWTVSSESEIVLVKNKE